MTRVSKNKLTKETEEQLFRQFVLVFEAAEDKHLVRMFDALFTESEKTMFVKRMAMVFLIAERYSTYAIAKTLNVSDSTVRCVEKQAKAGRYDSLIGVTRTDSFDHQRFWETVDVLLRCGLPPRGKDRWKWLDKNLAR